ncbi:MAG: type I 3-dehydroquinate dehydratase [Acidobacteria bacterium]|nr:type I 3-dehydroquinate dehydratase [Acidobacteriota bacterium]
MTQIRIVETVTASDMASLLRGRDASTDADLVELRLDGVRDIDVAGALRGRRLPVVVTCRPVWEGGRFDGSEDERRGLISAAVAGGAEFVDVERRATWRPELAGTGCQLVLSDHDFGGVPSDLRARVGAMRAERPAVVKIAVMPLCAADCLVLRDLHDVADAQINTVLIGMGGFGRITRALPAWFGSCWTYARPTASSETPSTPGQFSARDLARQFNVRETTVHTALYAVTGRPLEHSASPAMHNAAFQAARLDAVYVPLQAVDAADAMALAEALGVRGMSVTAPLKSVAGGWPVTLCDEASAALGTVNTLKRTPAGWQGRNVDGDGFLDACDARGMDLTARRVVVLGAGGAARSVAHALRGRGAIVSVSARRTEEATRLADAVGAEVEKWPPVGEWNMLVNATTVGTWPDEEHSPVSLSDVDPGGVRAEVVYDLVYNPEHTTLLQAAVAAGASAIGGLEMLVGQAVRQSAWWTGRTPSAAVMTEAARAWVASGRDQIV